MNDYISAIIIGIIEGLTEFLPVSSTAHIRLTQDLLQLPLDDSYWKMFAIVIQLGAILSVLVYFRTRIVEFVQSYPTGRSGLRTWWNHPIALVILSFVVTAIPCFIMDKFIGDMLENKMAIGWALLLGGLVMWYVDRTYSPRATTEKMEDMTLRQAIVIGLTQILAAAFPGTSRSMSTIAGGQIMGLSRSAALEFSFFLSIPVMVAATSFKLLQFILKEETAVSTHQWAVLAVGFVVSFLVAWVVIAWFMTWVRRHGFTPFAIYRIIIGIFTIAWAYRELT
ncbi:undecaprenyl-diphosphate phosphatase [Aureliella helgolandensis]|uniref:Undecaprenyl-diphosphatase n=1 Tax=Aureliella helgolandensis TaxID=2527968 RepID=A0A518GHN3_9BACT|nr:undecaprenyl-diphosphate phosphatase [Aureliella helgolandensis]QDV28040.1 Undecaprenyl-diphosphatase [Aureliella helgolandensis]